MEVTFTSTLSLTAFPFSFCNAYPVSKGKPLDQENKATTTSPFLLLTAVTVTLILSSSPSEGVVKKAKIKSGGEMRPNRFKIKQNRSSFV
jgi:hypothetical protein